MGGVRPASRRVEQVLQRFGANVRAARDARGWTQEDLSGRSGLAVVQVSRIERGKREIRLTTLLRLADAFDMRPDELLEGLYGQSSAGGAL